MTDLRDRVADGVRAAMGEAWDDATEYVHLPAVAARHLLPVIAAREAEVVGRILDRIDALHAKSTTRVYTERECQDGICDDHYDPISGAIYCPSYLLDVCRECSHYCCDDGDHDEPFPCPTRRLTAEIRGEMSHG